MRLASDLHNFEEYLRHHNAPHSIFCFGGSDLQDKDSIMLFLFSNIPCEVQGKSLLLEGKIKTGGCYVSHPEKVEKTALDVAKNHCPEFHLAWSDHRGGYEGKSYGVILREQSESLDNKVDFSMNSARLALYILKSRY